MAFDWQATELRTRNLIAKAQTGDLSARNELLKSHHGFVIYCARPFYRRDGFVQMDDLIQQGLLGLMRAISKFDLKKKSLNGQPVHFASYARFWIEHKMSREIQKRGHTVRRGGTAVPLELVLQSEDRPVMRHLPVQDAPPDDPEQSLRQQDSVSQVHRLLALLPKRERFVLERCFGLGAGGEGHPTDEVALQLGVTAGRVRQLRNKALERLRTHVKLESRPASQTRRWTVNYSFVLLSCLPVLCLVSLQPSPALRDNGVPSGLIRKNVH